MSLAHAVQLQAPPPSARSRRLRELGISDPPQTRCHQVPDEPGAEMQHDTSVYQVELAGRRTRLIASLI